MGVNPSGGSWRKHILRRSPCATCCPSVEVSTGAASAVPSGRACHPVRSVAPTSERVMMLDVTFSPAATQGSAQMSPGDASTSFQRSASCHLPALLAFWRDVMMGEALLRLCESRADRCDICKADLAAQRAMAVVRGEAVSAEVEVAGDVWLTFGRVAASTPRDLVAHACRIQARRLCRTMQSGADSSTARRAWSIGAADLTSGRSPHALRLILDREVVAAALEDRYGLMRCDPWPTGVLTVLSDVAESDGFRVLELFRARGQVPTATVLQRAIRKHTTSVRR